jgi:two-component system cell cycle sensor histidine kinase/response regulator CckA
MGLATVYGIVKQSGGFIFCDSASGHGTVMRIYLPRATDSGPALTRAPRTGRRPPGPETVLVVEDEDLVRAFARRTLERAGYRVYDAANARDALSTARALGPALSVLLSDIVMPDLNGRELAAAIESELPQVAIVLMSGFANEHDGAAAHPRSPNWGFMRKPFTVAELRSKVQAALADAVPR